MKIKKNKFLVGTMLSALSVGLVGSVASTFAWYTYNTKDTITYEGVASGNTENLQIRLLAPNKSDVTAGWSTSLSSDEIIADSVASKHAGTNLRPVYAEKSIGTAESPATGLNYNSPLSDSDFSGHPVGNDAGKSTDVADASGNKYWFQTQIQFRCIDPNEAGVFYAKAVYLSFLKVNMKVNGKDVSDAIRLHFSSGSDNLLIAPGVDSQNDVTTNLYGSLDIDGVAGIDKGYCVTGTTSYLPEYQEGITDMNGDGVAGDPVDVPYGTKNSVETAKSRNNALGTFSNGKHNSGTGYAICTTGNTEVLTTVTMTIYLNGWASQMIDANAKAEFSLAMIFQCDTL